MNIARDKKSSLKNLSFTNWKYKKTIIFIMAIGRILNSGHFITQFLFRNRLKWEYPGDWGNVEYPEENSLFDARFLGYRNATNYSSIDGSNIYQNCAGWVFGINKYVNPELEPKKRVQAQQDDILSWIKRVRIKNPNDLEFANKIIETEHSFRVYSARVDGANNMTDIGTLQWIEDGNQYEDYVPKENDIIVYCGADQEGEQSYVQHVSLYFDTNSVYGDLQGRKKGEEGYVPSLKWTSKMGDLGLIQHELAMLEKTKYEVDKINYKYILNGTINFPELGYGKVEFLITSA